MTSGKIKSDRGISLVSLVITIMVMMILANIIIYNVKDDIKLGNLAEMQNDIDTLREKVSSYYTQNGKIPANIYYTNVESIKAAGVISEAVDIGDFLVIDLSALENLTLNNGKDFEKVKENPENADNYTDLYIINEISHNVFYVAGITVGDDTFYTDYTSENIDTVPVNLRYIEGVRIPDGFYYVRGTKEEGIIIKSDDDTEEYEWVQQEEIAEVPSDIEIDVSEEEDFIKSVNAYQGYYRSVNTSQERSISATPNKVIYLTLEKDSLVYDKEGTYRDKNGDTAYIPQGFSVSEIPGEDTINQGLVVKDSNQNEWVWIEVPKSIYTTAKSSEDYENIEKDMQTYASDYRDSNYTDTWYAKEQHGFESSSEYNNWKNNMLKSVYEKGGFYIGRYEVGTTTARTSNSDTETTPIIQSNAYPYNYITCEQAQTLARSLRTEENTTISLIFGIQWDLVLKDIETKGAKTQSELKTNSTTWGNYLNSTFDITRKNVQYINSPSTRKNWESINIRYTKLNASDILLTTGATDRNCTLNIYDLAGNVWEWTLEGTNDTSKPCSVRSGSSHDDGNTYPVSQRFNDVSLDANHSLGFRCVLY